MADWFSISPGDPYWFIKSLAYSLSGLATGFGLWFGFMALLRRYVAGK